MRPQELESDDLSDFGADGVAKIDLLLHVQVFVLKYMIVLISLLTLNFAGLCYYRLH